MPAPRSTSRPLPPWLRPIQQRFSPVVRALVLALLASLLVYAFVEPLRSFIVSHLALGPDALPGQPWQIVTALFVERSFFGLISILALWFVGASVEQALGTRRFLLLFFASGLASNAAIAGLGLVWPMPFVTSGCGDAVLGLFVALGTIYGRTSVRVFGALAVPARTLAGFFVVFAVVMALAARAWPMAVGTLVATVLAYLLAGGKGTGLGDLWSRWRQSAHRRRYQVLEGGRKGRRKDYLN
jgi:membrane associated rhomboid family serine protease